MTRNQMVKHQINRKEDISYEATHGNQNAKRPHE